MGILRGARRMMGKWKYAFSSTTLLQGVAESGGPLTVVRYFTLRLAGIRSPAFVEVEEVKHHVRRGFLFWI